MIQHSTEQDLARRHPSQKAPGVAPEANLGHDRGEGVSLRIEVPGYGGASLKAVVPAGTVPDIEGGDRPVDTELGIEVPGYGRRVAGVRVSPGDLEGTAGAARPVRARVSGYGGAPLKLAFPARER